MVTVLISDVHGNAVALEAVLRDAERHAPDAFVCLGDVAATGPRPRECVELLRQLRCPIVLGNTDAWLVDPRATAPTDPTERVIQEIDMWCHRRLTPTDLAYLRSFEDVIEVPLEGGASITCFHGSPLSFDHGLLPTTPDEELAEVLGDAHAALLACGHTHVPMVRPYGASRLVNPGSVGLPFVRRASGRVVHPARAEYAVVRSERGGSCDVTLAQCPVDVRAVLHAARESGMPHAETWAEGWERGL